MIVFIPFHCSTVRLKDGRTRAFFSGSAVVTDVSKEMGSLKKPWDVCFSVAWPLTQISILLWRGNLLVWGENSSCLLVCFTNWHQDRKKAGGKRKRELFHLYANSFLTLKTRCVSIREPINKSWLELETVLVNENFNELQTAFAPLLADCDDVLSRSRLELSLLFFCFSEAVYSFFPASFSHKLMRDNSRVSEQKFVAVLLLDFRLHGNLMLLYLNGILHLSN